MADFEGDNKPEDKKKKAPKHELSESQKNEIK